MFFMQRSAPDATLSYFLGCGGLGRAVAVDVVAGDEQWFIDAAAKQGARIEYVIDTHVHADHVRGGAGNLHTAISGHSAASTRA